MKCVQNTDGRIVRVSENVANVLLAKGSKFINKEAWKLQERGTYTKGVQASTVSNQEKRKKGYDHSSY